MEYWKSLYINSEVFLIITYLCPIANWAVAMVIALSPLAQTLLTVVQGMESGSPAPRAAWRAGACPNPDWRTQPMYT